MTWLTPGFLIVAAGAAAGVVGLHFIVSRLPPSASLPTARFVPIGPATIVAAAKTPRDVGLLAWRAAAVLLAGAAFARPRLEPSRAPERRLVLVDRSRNVADVTEVRDSVRRLLRPGDLLVVFDSVARVVPADSLETLARSAAPGALSTALIAARRAAAQWRESGDSIDLLVVSPLATGETDAATAAIRALWPGRLAVVRVASRSDPAALPVVTVRAASDDPLRAAAPLRAAPRHATDPSLPSPPDAGAVRLVRDDATATDSAWARDGQGRVLIVWPAIPSARTTPPGRPSRADAVAAVIALRPDPVAVVAPWARGAPLEAPHGARQLAWWEDGEPAAVERALGSGCVRDINIDVPSASDLVLRPEFSRLVDDLRQPCGGASMTATPMGPAAVAALAGTGPLARGRAVATATSSTRTASAWLLAAALALLLLEPLVRRARRTRAPMAVATA